MNFVDLFFLLLFVGALAIGFFQGMVRLGVLIIALYLSVVLASLYFPTLANVFVTRFGSPRFVGEYVGFTIILLIGFATLAAPGIYTFRYVELPGSLRFLDYTIGLVFGLLLGSVLIGIFASLLWNLMIVRGARTIDFPLMGWLGDQVVTSFLPRYFSTEILPAIYRFLDPILPAGADILFRI